MTSGEFDHAAEMLRQAVQAWYREHDQQLVGRAGHNTLETNSGFVERRGAPLLAMLRRHAGIDSIRGLDLVDLGAGFGALSVFFAFHRAAVTAVDVNDSRLDVGREVARRLELNATFERGRMEALPLPDASFDIAVHNNSFCYVVDGEDRRSALSEALRVLRPGGWLIQRDPSRWTPVDPFSSVPLIHMLPPSAASRAASALGRPRSHVRLASPLQAKRELRQAGFERVIWAPPAARPGVGRVLARYQHFLARRSPVAEASA